MSDIEDNASDVEHDDQNDDQNDEVDNEIDRKLAEELEKHKRPKREWNNIRTPFIKDNSELKEFWSVATYIATGELHAEKADEDKVKNEEIVAKADSLDDTQKKKIKKAYEKAKEKFEKSDAKCKADLIKWTKEFPELADFTKSKRQQKRKKTMVDKKEKAKQLALTTLPSNSPIVIQKAYALEKYVTKMTQDAFKDFMTELFTVHGTPLN
jgi:hypothetical protein